MNGYREKRIAYHRGRVVRNRGGVIARISPRGNDEMQRRSVRQEHGAGDFYYSMLPDLQPHPVIRCLCGAFPEEIFHSWAEAGLWLDRHIVSALRKDDLVYHEMQKKNGPPAPAAAAAGKSK